jgi:hypothetical protein
MRFSVVVSAVFSAALSLSISASPVSPLECDGPGSTAGASGSGINANSCTDFSMSQGVSGWYYGFYGPTGLGAQTSPGDYSPTGFHEMTPFIYQGANEGYWANDFLHFWTSIGAEEAHPNSMMTNLHSPFCDPNLWMVFPGINPPSNCGSGVDPNSPNSPDSQNQWAVRRYVVPADFNGMVDLTVAAQKDSRTFNTGAADGTTLYAMLYHNGVTSNIGVLTIGAADPAIHTMSMELPLSAGDYLDFALAPNSNDFSDGTFELITIDSVLSAPEPSSAALLIAGLGIAGLLRRRWRT